MVHAVDSKSTGGNTLGVRVPPPAPVKDCRETKLYQQTGQTARSAFCYIKGIIEQETRGRDVPFSALKGRKSVLNAQNSSDSARRIYRLLTFCYNLFAYHGVPPLRQGGRRSKRNNLRSVGMQNKTISMDAAHDFYAKMPLARAIPLGLQHVFAMFVGNLTRAALQAASSRIFRSVSFRTRCSLRAW